MAYRSRGRWAAGIGSSPVSGSIAVFTGPGFSEFGHVAYVESVNGDGSINVTEMAWGGWGAGEPCVRSHIYAAGTADGYIFPASASSGTPQKSWLFDTAGSTLGWDPINYEAQNVSGRSGR